MKDILVVIPVQQRHKDKLEQVAPGCNFRYIPVNDVTEADIADANIIIGNVPAGKIHASEKLEWIQLNSAGAEPYIKPGVLAEKTALTNATGAYSKAVAEHCFAATLMLQKKLHLYRDHQSLLEWADEGTVTSMSDATVLVVGLGDIGLHYARLCKAMGAHTIGVKRRPGRCPEGVDELFLTEELDSVLPRADVVVSFLPAMPSTYHIYTEERFAAMKDSALFVNGGRGNAVSSDVLDSAVRNGLIRAAAVDVTEPEPLPAGHPLWKNPNVVLTPHISGQYHLPETFERIVNIAASNLEAFLNGKPMKNAIDFTTGYCK